MGGNVVDFSVVFDGVLAFVVENSGILACSNGKIGYKTQGKSNKKKTLEKKLVLSLWQLTNVAIFMQSRRAVHRIGGSLDISYALG